VIVKLATVDEIPKFDDGDLGAVRAVLTDGHFARVAVFEYDFLDEHVSAAIFEDTQGRWWDLRGAQLIIEPLSATNQAALFAMPKQPHYPD
jgi:hypothetical protein